MKVNTYKVLFDCIQRGIDGGWQQAHKYTNKPSEFVIKEQIEHYISLEVCEFFSFDNCSVEDVNYIELPNRTTDIQGNSIKKLVSMKDFFTGNLNNNVAKQRKAKNKGNRAKARKD